MCNDIIRDELPASTVREGRGDLPTPIEIKTNLDFARKMTIDDIKVIPKVGFQKLLSDFTSKYYYDTWAWIAVAFSFLFLAFFAG